MAGRSGVVHLLLFVVAISSSCTRPTPALDAAPDERDTTDFRALGLHVTVLSGEGANSPDPRKDVVIVRIRDGRAVFHARVNP